MGLGYSNEGPITGTAGEALEADRMVRISAGTFVYCDAAEEPVGITTNPAAINTKVSVLPINSSGIAKVTGSKAIAAGATIYPATDGKVSDAAGGGRRIGTLWLDAITADGGKAAALINVFSGDAFVYLASVTLTAAQIKLLATTQIELIPAPGADKVIQVLGIDMILDYGSEVLAEPSAPDDLEVVYDTAGGTSIADVIGDFVINAADTIAQPQIKDIAGVAASTMVNKAVVLDNNGTDYTGNATGDTLLTVICTYKVHEAGLA